MKTNKLTEASMFSALFVVISLIVLSTGIAYSTYLVVGVPIVSALIYFKCDFKYTLMALFCAVIIISFVVGDISSAIFMAQGIVIGVICSYFLTSKINIYDSMLYCSVISCFFIVFVDLTFSSLIGVSFIEEFKKDVQVIPISEMLQNAIYYILIISVPIGTVLCTFLGALLLGKKLNLLNSNSKSKFVILSNFKMYISYLSCSDIAIKSSVIYIIIFEILDYFNLKIPIFSINEICHMVEYILFYFVIEDCLGFLFKYVYDKFNSKVAVNIVQILVIALLILNFRFSLIVLVSMNFLINKKFKLRDKQRFKLNRKLYSAKVAIMQ